MSKTQPDNTGIPFSHAPTGTGYKLVELPPELLELLESPNPPTYGKKKTTSLTLHPSATTALLKTPSKTYSLRQKNTSNALILLTPTPTAAATTQGGNGLVGGGDFAESGGLDAIATVHETIELVAGEGQLIPGHAQ
ncbi:hypothetical protein BT67DRAFT_297510 [Trichocladium antarcticum]|uniref:Uncharacterized protein n=1 Tax=Trichocladium antarcticum TaxID=1450529 RepID=A0AAN6ZE93_9PEZI|nr:hypothetical protein BT67DRAFT_297510 [Trichocladium antarcticum]